MYSFCAFRSGVADIVDVEAQCLGEVVKTLKLELLERLDKISQRRIP